MAHCSLELLGSSDPPASASQVAGITGLAQPIFIIINPHLLSGHYLSDRVIGLMHVFSFILIIMQDKYLHKDEKIEAQRSEANYPVSQIMC